MTQELLNLIHTNREHYYHTNIPKKSGGSRQIFCIEEHAKNKYKPLVQKLQLLHVDKNAVGYRKGIGTINVAHKHGRHNWFYKFDFTNFFPSFSADMILEHLKGFTTEEYAKLLWVKNRDDAPKLQQGNPLSPTATNVIMAKFDKQFFKKLKKLFGVPITYSRYADDILVSSYQRLDFKKILKLIRKTLKENKLNEIKVNTKKSRELKKGQKVFFLGVSINKESSYGVGHKHRKNVLSVYRQIMRNKKTFTAKTIRKIYHQVIYINAISKNKIDIEKFKNRLVSLHHTDRIMTVKELALARHITTRVDIIDRRP